MNSMDIAAVGRKVNDANGVQIGRACVTNGPDTVGRPSGANVGGIIGVVQQVGYDGRNGDTCAVRYYGEADLVFAGAGAIGDAVVVADNTGAVMSAATLAAGTVVRQVGIQEEATAAAGDAAKVLLTPGVIFAK